MFWNYVVVRVVQLFDCSKNTLRLREIVLNVGLV